MHVVMYEMYACMHVCVATWCHLAWCDASTCVWCVCVRVFACVDKTYIYIYIYIYIDIHMCVLYECNVCMHVCMHVNVVAPVHAWLHVMHEMYVGAEKCNSIHMWCTWCIPNVFVCGVMYVCVCDVCHVRDYVFMSLWKFCKIMCNHAAQIRMHVRIHIFTYVCFCVVCNACVYVM